MGESGQHRAEGGYGAPPGAAQWPSPGAAQWPSPGAAQWPLPPGTSAAPAAYPPPTGEPYPPQYAPASVSPFPVSTVLLLAVSLLSLLATGVIGLPSAIVSIVAWRRSARDPAAGRKLTMTAWIVYAGNFAVGVPLLIWFYVWALRNQ